MISESCRTVSMMICGGFGAAVSRFTHSMPFIPGKFTSMSTTCGFSAGRIFSASSALANEPTQSKSSSSSRIVVSPQRIRESSSTMAMVIGAVAGLLSSEGDFFIGSAIMIT